MVSTWISGGQIHVFKFRAPNRGETPEKYNAVLSAALTAELQAYPIDP